MITVISIILIWLVYNAIGCLVIQHFFPDAPIFYYNRVTRPLLQKHEQLIEEYQQKYKD